MPLTHCHSAVSALNDDCQCHSLGSLEPKCDIDGNCRCRAGVGGAKCDHCLPGFWGLHLIALGQQSCQPCGCSAFGSSRHDCEQSTGRCECWRGARGDRCERCTTDLVMTASGCVPRQEYRTPASCSSLECHHGAKCVQSVGELPDCECPEHCDMNHLGIVANMSVCGSDGTTYENMCQLLKFACKHQLDLVAVSLGICFQDSTEPHERRNRNKETFIEQLGTECKPDSPPSSICRCPPSEIVDNGRCLSDVNSLLSLNLDGQRIYQLEKQDFQLPMNVSITVAPRSSSGLILFAKGVRGAFTLRIEMRRVVAGFGKNELYSHERLTLGKNYTIVVFWSGDLVSLRLGGNAMARRVAFENESVMEFSIGGNPAESFTGLIVELSINGRAIRHSDLISSADVRFSYVQPVFVGNDEYIELKNVAVDVEPRLQIILSLKKSSNDGMILYWGPSLLGQTSGNFISIMLVDSKIHLFWVLGEDTKSIRTQTSLKSSWTSIRFELTPSNASVYLNETLVSSVSCKTTSDSLQIGGHSVFLGGVPNVHLLPRQLRHLRTQFSGTFKRLELNERLFNLFQAIIAKKSNSSVIHQSVVVPVLRNRDDTNVEDNIFVDGTADYAYLNAGNSSEFSSHTSNFSFEFRSESTDGLLWWESEWSGATKSDFLIVFLRNGHVHIAVSLGRDFPKSVATKQSVTNGTWHKISVEREKNLTAINVDGKTTTMMLPEGATHLNTNGLVFLGGRTTHPLRHQFKGSFTGCFRRVVIRGFSVELVRDAVSPESPSRCVY